MPEIIIEQSQDVTNYINMLKQYLVSVAKIAYTCATEGVNIDAVIGKLGMAA